MFRNLLITASAALLLGGGIFAQEGNERAEVFLEGLSRARYTLAEGIIRAQMKVPGRVLGAKVDVEREKRKVEVTYKVYILRKGRIYKVEVDGISGKVEEVKAGGKFLREKKEEKGEKAGRKSRRRRRERGEREEEEENERAEHKGKNREKEEAEEEEENEHPGRAEHKSRRRRGERDREKKERSKRRRWKI